MHIDLHIPNDMDAFESETRTAMLGVVVTKEGRNVK
jgi:hypothetical protein